MGDSRDLKMNYVQDKLLFNSNVMDTPFSVGAANSGIFFCNARELHPVL